MNNVADEEFVRAFEACNTPNEGFHHRDHIRLAWIYHRLYGREAAARIAAAIRKFAAHHGKSDKYHETVTQAWMRLVAHCSEAETADFESFAARHPELLDKTLLSEFYSDALLQSDLARERFAAPDRKPLPD